MQRPGLGAPVEKNACSLHAHAGITWHDLSPQAFASASIGALDVADSDPNVIYVGTGSEAIRSNVSIGRGIYKYNFAPPHAASRPGPGCRDRTAPTSKFRKTARTARASRRVRLSGTSSDRGCGKKFRGTVRRIRISVARITGRKCRSMTSSGRLSRKRTSCRKTSYVNAKGKTKWSFTAKRRLPKGTYQIWVRGIDAAGNVEHKKRKRNFKRLRLL